MVASRRPRSARRSSLVAALIAVSALLAVPATPSVDAASDRLPDLRMAPFAEFRIELVNGRRLLRFSSTTTNTGAGPFTVRSSRTSTTAAWRVEQVIRDTAGGSRAVPTAARMSFGGDGHGHWHVERVVDVDLWTAGRTGKGAKIGFCFFDTKAVDRSLPGAPRSPVYHETDCARSSQVVSTTGVSVGWGDRYPWWLPFQWVDITGLPGGTYTIRSWVDGGRLFLEGSDSNNCAWSRIRFGSTGSSVTVLGSGFGCVNDYSGSVHAADIRWAMEKRVIAACGLDLFCPGVYVTRGQTARWIAGWLRLPATSTDFYADDNGHRDEASINRLAAAGFAVRCGPTRYCPNDRITRADLAATLVRAFALPPTATDYFTDDDDHPREGDINRARAAAIMYACSGTRFCPANGVTRAAFAAYLHRAAT